MDSARFASQLQLQTLYILFNIFPSLCNHNFLHNILFHRNVMFGLGTTGENHIQTRCTLLYIIAIQTRQTSHLLESLLPCCHGLQTLSSEGKTHIYTYKYTALTSIETYTHKVSYINLTDKSLVTLIFLLQ